VGMITSLFAVGLILYAIITKFLGIAAPGTSSVLIAVALFGGIVLMSNGVIGIYIARIYYEVKGRPRYIISSILAPKNRL
jgi:polyisoprenyl-phosphate glycosyltransferase